MKIARLLLPAILILALSCWAKRAGEQKTPVLLKGRLTSLDLESNESWRLKYQAHFDLEVVNVSDEKILLIRRDPVVVYSAFEKWAPGGEVTFEASENTGGSMKRSALDHKLPPAESTVLLKPGESYTTRTTIPLEFYPPGSDRSGKPFYPQSKMAKLELELAKWPFILYDDLKKQKDADEDDDYSFSSSEFPEVLQKRWAKTGKLYLEDIESEPIEIPLPAPPETRKHSGLAVRGHVESIQMVEETNDGIRFNVDLDLKFVNTGARPVIVLRPEAERLFFQGGWDVSIECAGISDDRKAMEMGTYTHLRCWRKSVSRDDNWRRLQDALDQPEPPDNLVWIIPPGGATTTYHTSTGLDFRKTPDPYAPRSAEKKDQLWGEIAKAQELWLNVDVEVWSFNVEPKVDDDNPEFARKLRQRWAARGEFEFGVGGHITSEPMELPIPIQYKQAARTVEAAKNE